MNFSPTLVNLIGSVVYGLLIPYVAIGRTLLYFDLEAREAKVPEGRWRRWLEGPVRPRRLRHGEAAGTRGAGGSAAWTKDAPRAPG